MVDDKINTPKITIDSTIPGGNIIVKNINEFDIVLLKDMRDTSGKWFYWEFKAVFHTPGTYTFIFDDGTSISSRGPALSYDDGMTWQWMNKNDYDNEKNIFRYHYKKDSTDTVTFCLSMNYLEKNLTAFVAKHLSNPNFSCQTLCKSSKGRDVELLKITNPDIKSKKKIFLSSRHHCCEMTATYVLEGILEEALNNHEFQNMFEVWAVPFVDKDGVEDGDQGKNRLPHDHARDYGPRPIYPEVKKNMELIQREKMDMVMDIHCPGLRNNHNELIYFVGPESKYMEKEIMNLAKIIEENSSGIIPFSASDIIRFGTSWNTGTNYTTGKPLARWATELEYVKLAASIEIPYANSRDFTFTSKDWRTFGHLLVRSLLKYAHIVT
jgi:Zinc carboxypeptidase